MESVGWQPAADAAAMSAWTRRRQRPDNELPVPADLPPVLYRDDAIGVGLLGSVHTTGLAMTVSLHLRHPPVRSPHRMGGLLSDLPDTPPDERFLFGVQLADGRAVRPLDRPMPHRPVGPPADSEHLLFRTGGHGGSASFSMNYWLTPLPPAGPTLLVVRCPGLGLPETTVEFDAGPVREAAHRVAVLWPPAASPGQPAAPPPPDPPSEGWFAVRS